MPVPAHPAILSLGLPPSDAKSVVRFSLSRLTTQAEIDSVIEIVARIVSEARQLAGPSGVRREA